jgi:MFS transporter, DHA1 family, multidrug resistance protein
VAEIRTLSRRRWKKWEKIALYALLISLTAVSIDIVLPAYQILAQEFSLATVTQLQNNILIFIVGMFFGEFIAGFYADIIGRKRTLLVSVAVYLLGTVLCFYAEDYVGLLFGRALQGVGAAGQKVCTRALIRDHFSGAAMAQVMSLVMITFIFLPFLAPALGSVIVDLWDWRTIFIFLAAFALMVFTWFWLRQPETLPSTQKNHAGLVAALRLFRIYITHPHTCGYTLAAGILFGAHLAFLSMSPLVLSQLYSIQEEFPLYFGGIAGGFGVALFFNARVVKHLGMQRMVHWALMIMLMVAGLMTILSGSIAAKPAWIIFFAYLVIILFCLGLIFGNLNALIMEPLGAAAGLGNAFASACSTLVALPVSYLMGWVYQKTAFSFIAPVFLCACAAVACCMWAQRGKERIFGYD